MQSRVLRKIWLRDVENVKFLTIVELDRKKENEIFKRYIIPNNESLDLKAITQENCPFKEDILNSYESKQKTSKKEYSLTYVNMRELMQKYRWALNFGHREIWNEHNQHLFD